MSNNIGKCFVCHLESGQNLVYLITGVLSNHSNFYTTTVLRVGKSVGILLEDIVSYDRITKECEEIEEADFTQIYVHVLGKLATKVNATVSK